VGIEKIIPKFADLEVFLQLLPRSATGERMNPYNSIWTGVAPGDGRRNFTSSCWIMAARKCWPTMYRARRSTVSAAVRA